MDASEKVPQGGDFIRKMHAPNQRVSGGAM
jgi:hypothetical protein